MLETSRRRLAASPHVLSIVCLVAASAVDARAQGVPAAEVDVTNAGVANEVASEPVDPATESAASDVVSDVTHRETVEEASLDADVTTAESGARSSAETAVTIADAVANAEALSNAVSNAEVASNAEAVSTSAEPDAIDDHDRPAPVFVLFSPDWMPIVTLGYRTEQSWWRGARLSDAPEAHERLPTLLHGVAGSLLLPMLASGRPESKVRVALGVGAGVDFAMRRGGFVAVGRPYDPDAPVMRPDGGKQRFVTIQVHGQLGLILRAAPRGRGFLGSLLWLPTSRNFRITVTELPRLRERTRTVARARLTLGWVHDHVYVSVFAGFTQSGSEDNLTGRERTLETGLQLGSGW